jgi:hypothetical protein
MGLQSKQFKGDSSLEACLVRDSAHVTQGARGAHVRKIQEALALLDGAVIDASEKSGQSYGPSTAAAVLAYKRKRNIINPSYQTTADDIVGKMTIAKLDGDMLAREGAGPSPGPSPSPSSGLTIVPFREPVPMLIAKRDHLMSKGDLNSSPAITAGWSWFRRTKVEEVRKLKTLDLQVMMMAELQLGGQAGIEAARDFYLNRVAKGLITKGAGSTLGSMVKGSPEFQRAHAEVRTHINYALGESAATGILDYHVLAESRKKVPPPGISYRGIDSLHVVIGSFQGVRISLEDFSASATPRRYKATLIYEWFDHFGVDDSDIDWDWHGHGSPGQIALWILQRERHPGNMPYVLRVMFSEEIFDEF